MRNSSFKNTDELTLGFVGFVDIRCLSPELTVLYQMQMALKSDLVALKSCQLLNEVYPFEQSNFLLLI